MFSKDFLIKMIDILIEIIKHSYWESVGEKNFYSTIPGYLGWSNK